MLKTQPSAHPSTKKALLKLVQWHLEAPERNKAAREKAEQDAFQKELSEYCQRLTLATTSLIALHPHRDSIIADGSPSTKFLEGWAHKHGVFTDDLLFEYALKA